MSKVIEDYALLSDCHSAALVSKDGSIDWLSFPRFDSAACFSALLGDENHGRWKIAPQGGYQTRRTYIQDTVVLETTFTQETGSCKITDCMLMNDPAPTLVRSVEGIQGHVDLELQFTVRFDYGSIVPWVRRLQNGHGINAVGGPDGLVLFSPVPLQGKNRHTVANFSIHEGEKKTFSLIWYPSNEKHPENIPDAEGKLRETIEYWKNWSGLCCYQGFDRESVLRSLLTLKGLTYAPSGAIIAAPTTSLPETLGGGRNWDYRYSWLRDSSLTLYALIKGGYREEALHWEEWLHRAVAGNSEQVSTMYGIRGERRLTEVELPWLPGYENSSPVRIGNSAHRQFQLDVYGQVISTAHLGRKHGIPISGDSWNIEKNMIRFICENWMRPDEGIWEVRGERRQFTHSKVMAWVGLDSAVKSIKHFGLEGDLDHWTRLRNQIHRDICEKGFNTKLNSFVQSYGSHELDASLLMMGQVGFLPAQDPRMLGTVDAIKKHLTHNGHVFRYRSESAVDGLRGSEGSFIACSFWLVDNLWRCGRREEALEHYRALQSIKNDLGLFAEEFDPKLMRMIGNFPQAYSHVAQVASAMELNEKGSSMLSA